MRDPLFIGNIDPKTFGYRLTLFQGQGAALADLMASKWILPAIGDLPLANIDNMTIKPLVDKMKKSKSFSARSINKYVEYVRQVVTSLKDGETGEPNTAANRDSTVMDLPLVIQREQRRPSLKAAAVNRL